MAVRSGNDGLAGCMGRPDVSIAGRSFTPGNEVPCVRRSRIETDLAGIMHDSFMDSERRKDSGYPDRR